MEDVESRIDYTVVSDTEASVKRNRKFLISVFGALEYFCRQSILFREHRDDGNIFDKEQNNANKINFKELLILISEILNRIYKNII